MATRRQQISDKKKKKKQQKSCPLTPIYFCDADNCLNITTHEDRQWCPICKCFFYCSVECQRNHWKHHRKMCGENTAPEYLKIRKLYEEARDAAETIYQKVGEGNYTTVIHQKGDVPAAIFSTLATEKTNVLPWKQYIKEPLFTTTNNTSFGSMGNKVQAAQDKYPNHKIYIISVIFDRLKEGVLNKCVIRFFTAPEFGFTMDAPDGKLIKTSVKYSRK